MVDIKFKKQSYFNNGLKSHSKSDWNIMRFVVMLLHMIVERALKTKSFLQLVNKNKWIITQGIKELLRDCERFC